MNVRYFCATPYRAKPNEQNKMVQVWGLKSYNQLSLTKKIHPDLA